MIKPEAIHLLIPVTYENITEEKHRQEKASAWFDNFTDIVKEKYDIIPYPYYAFTKSDITTPEFTIKFRGATNKGLWVRSSIFSISTIYDYSKLKKTFVILIDGTGKIPLEQVENVLESLVEGYPIVLGCRIDNNWTNNEDRLAAEDYEKFIIEKKFNVKLPDSQCGCWGLRGDTFKDLALISNSYDIELDILINSLENGFSIHYVSIETQSGKSGFNIDANRKKINYLAYKLNYCEKDFLSFYDEFKKTKGKELPEEGYLEFIKKIDDDSMENKEGNITCLAHKKSEKCDNCNLKKDF